MIDKLVADAAAEASHKAFCDKEMSESKAKIEKRSSIGRRPFPSRSAELPRDASMRASLVFTSR